MQGEGERSRKEEIVYYNAENDLLIFPVHFNKLAHSCQKPQSSPLSWSHLCCRLAVCAYVHVCVRCVCVCYGGLGGLYWSRGCHSYQGCCLCSAAMSFLHNEGPQGANGEGGWLTMRVIQQECTAAREKACAHTHTHTYMKTRLTKAHTRPALSKQAETMWHAPAPLPGAGASVHHVCHTGINMHDCTSVYKWQCTHTHTCTHTSS